MRRAARSSTPATCSTRPPCGGAGSPTRASGADAPGSSSPGGAGFVGSHLCDVAPRARVTRSSRSTTSSPAAARTSRTSPTTPASTLVRADVIDEHPGRRARSTGAALREPREPARVPRACRSRRSTSGRSAPATRSTSRVRERRALPARVDERDLRRPARAPATRELQRQRQSDRAARGVRRGEALRRDAHDDVPPRSTASTPGSCASSTRTARGCARPTVASCRTSWCRRSTASRSRCTATATQTRSFCYVDDEVRGIARAVRLRRRRAGEHRQPDRVHDARARRARAARSPARAASDRVRAAADRRPDAAPARHHPGRARCSVGSRRSTSAKVSPARTTGTWRSAPWSHVTTTAPKLRKLSVIVPVFNERNTVVEVLRRMRAVELPDGIEREIIVVDDGSNDGTRDVLRQLGDSTVRVVMHDGNRGKGAAVRTGFAHVTGDYVLVQDADLEYDPEDWPKLLNPVLRGKARVVYGSRFTGERRNMLFLHWVGNRFLSLVTNVLYNTTLSDMETCYKLVDRTLLDGITLRAQPLRHRARDHREDPAGGASASTRCRSRTPAASSTRARRSRGATASPRSGRSSSTASWTDDVTSPPPGRRSSSTTRRGRSCSTACGRCSPTPTPRSGAGASSWSSSTTARPTARSPRCSRRIPDVTRGRPRRQRRATRPRPTSGSPPRPRPSSRCCNPDLVVEPGTAAAMLARLDAEPDLAAVGPRSATPTVPTTRRPGPTRRPSMPSATAVLGLWWPRNRFTRRYRQLDARSGPTPRRRLGVGRGDVAAPERARRGRRVGRALLHVHGGRRPLLAAAPPRVAGRLRAVRAS